jgi:hypothetical protein
MVSEAVIERVKAAELVFDYNLYPRNNINSMHVADIRRAIEAYVKLPPIVADRKSRRIVDGFHRARAALRISPDATIDVEWREYESEAELLLDAISLNATHGEKLTPYDRARCIALAQQYGIAMIRLAEALRVRTVDLETLTTRKLAYADDGVVPIKGTLRHLAGMPLSNQQLNGNRRAGGPSPLFFIAQVKNLIENDLIDRSDESIMAALRELCDLIADFLKKQRK